MLAALLVIAAGRRKLAIACAVVLVIDWLVATAGCQPLRAPE